MYVTFKQIRAIKIVPICFAAGSILFYCPFNIKPGLPKSNIYSAYTCKQTPYSHFQAQFIVRIVAGIPIN